MSARVGVEEVEVAEEGVAPDGVVGEEAAEPAAGGGEAEQVEAAEVLGHLRPHVRLVPAFTNACSGFQPNQWQNWTEICNAGVSS